MSFVHGKNAVILVGPYARTAYLHSADVSLDVDVADTTTFASGWKTAIPGTIGSTVALAGYYDPALTTFADLVSAAEGTVVTVCPGGASAIGDVARLVSVAETGFAKSSPVGGVVAFTANLMSVGVVGMGWVLHPLTSDTDTTVGTSRNDGAATATGWTAHLHVDAISAGSWVVKLEDSANNSDWADVTGGAFTAATGATSQRLRGAAEDTALRRYVRYTATRTGGAASDAINFHLSYARN